MRRRGGQENRRRGGRVGEGGEGGENREKRERSWATHTGIERNSGVRACGVHIQGRRGAALTAAVPRTAATSAAFQSAT